MLNTKPVVSNRYAFLEELVKKHIKSVITPAILHPGKREQGKSFNRREQMRRNKAKYGKRQICIHLHQNHIAIQRDYHMRQHDTEIKVFDTKPMSYLDSYRASLVTSGYVLLDANPGMLIFQYEGRIH